MKISNLDKIKDLVKKNKDFSKIKKNLENLKEEIKKKEQEVLILKENSLLVEIEKNNILENIKTLENKIKDLNLDLLKKTEKINNSSKSREIEGFQKESNFISLELNKIENELIKNLNKIEKINSENFLKIRDFDTESLKINEELEDKKSLIIKYNEEIEILSKEIDICVSFISKDFIFEYKKIKEIASDPIVEIISGACEACFYQVNNQDMQLLKNNNLTKCKDCYRFLYFDKN